MRCEWKTIAFGDLLEEPVRNGLTKPKAIRGTGVKMIAMGEIFAYSRIADVVTDRAPVTEKELQNCSIKPLDILFARQSLTLEGAGKCSIVTDVLEDTVFESHLIRTRVNQEKADPFFLYYYFNSPHGKENIKSIVEQVAAAGIRGSDLIKLSVPYPSLEKQRKISAILRSFDEKIGLNDKINENLVQQVQAIYQEWFGNTDVTKKQGNISDICSYSKDRVAVSKLDVNTYFSTENMLPGKAGATEASSLPTTAQATACHVGDTLISNIRPYFKKIVYCREECGCSTDVLCFVPAHSKYSAYLYSTLYADRFFDFMVAGSKGTKMPRGDKQQIMTYPVTLPTDTELERFNSVAVPILTQIQNNRNENQRLSALRDTLLPKLMNGEMDVDGI